ncbi:hypothetical protein GYH30_001394 [Glycine max]|uniref:Solute carrier family 40 member n=1 Tax=Glycine max TaxID=3847 RepID=K7K3J4_SOYBN|nr:hypothetical protein GYH30_001394 [Glycine max]
MWEFSVGLYMINIWPDSSLYAAIYGTIESASTALFDPIIGRWVDKLSYVKVLKLWLVTQNLSFVIAGATVIAYLSTQSLKFTNFPAFILLVNPPELLTKMNSVTRRIDLTCKLLAPVVTGFIISFVSLKASALTLALWNTVSVWVEYWLFTSVYKGIPALGLSSQRRMERPSQIYLKEEVALPGLALALLFFTEYLHVIGIARGISAGIEIAATVVYPVLQSQISTIRTGLWSIWSQLEYGQSGFLSSYILMGSVAIYRLGLWMFDLSDLVPESDRLIVGGVQNSLQSLMDLLAYVMGIIISNPRVICSFLEVTLAAFLYCIHVYHVRKHIFHFERLKWS